MSYYKICPHCGAALDPGENCDCFRSKYARLTPENKRKIDALVLTLVEKQNAARGAANTQDGGVEQVDHAVSISKHT